MPGHSRQLMACEVQDGQDTTGCEHERGTALLDRTRAGRAGHDGNLVFGSRRTASTPGGGPGVWRGSEGRYRRRTPMLKATFRRVHQAPKRRRLEDRHRFIGLCSDDGDRVAECPEFFDSLLELHPELGVGELDLWPFLPFSPPDLHPAQR